MFQQIRIIITVFCALLILLALVAAAEPRVNTLKPFATDGCSMWIDGTAMHSNSLRHCCVAHDKAYWIGGSKEQRKKVDEDLKICITRESNFVMADYMYFMVRWGGHPDWFNWYRWGYGWNYIESGALRGYKTPTEEEQQQIDLLLPSAEKTIEDDLANHPMKK